jgi:hypothetical protein
MQQHPRWPLYKKLRRAIALELAATKAVLAHDKDVTEGDVDDYLRVNMRTINRDLNRFFRFDSGCRECDMRHEGSRPAEIEEA